MLRPQTLALAALLLAPPAAAAPAEPVGGPPLHRQYDAYGAAGRRLERLARDFERLDLEAVDGNALAGVGRPLAPLVAALRGVAVARLSFAELRFGLSEREGVRPRPGAPLEVQAEGLAVWETLTPDGVANREAARVRIVLGGAQESSGQVPKIVRYVRLGDGERGAQAEVEALSLRGRRLVTEGGYSPAAVALASAIDRRPAAAAYLLGASRFQATDLVFLAAALHGLDDLEGALQTAERAVALEPRFALAVDRLARLCLEAGQVKRAVALWRGMGRLVHDELIIERVATLADLADAYPVAALGELLSAPGADRQLVALDGLVVRHGETPAAGRLRAALLWAVGGRDAAGIALEETRIRFPWDRETSYRYALYLVRRKRYLEGARVLESLRLQQAGYRHTERLLGELYVRLEDAGRARAALEAARRLDPDDPLVYLYLGNVALQEGKPFEASTWLEAGLARDPWPAVRRALEASLAAP